MTAPFDSIPQYIDEEEEESAGSLRMMECKQNLKRLTYQIVQLRGPGFTPQLSERRSVLRPLEKPATGSCNCVAPDSLLNCQREEALAHRLLEKPATGMQTERKIKLWRRIHSSSEFRREATAIREQQQ